MPKIVYVALAADILHVGHINILKKASKLGNVTVGLLTDSAINEYKKLPILSYSKRLSIISNLKFVHKVIKQNEMDYRPNLRKIKPDFVVHGNDWKRGILSNTRKQVIKELKKWSGKLVEIPYTRNISSTAIKKEIQESSNFQINRISLLRRLISTKKIVRVLESHSALTGIIAEETKVSSIKNIEEFDCLWSSSLTESLIRGKPDNQSVSLETRISALSELMDVTVKPVIFDADNGGRIEHLPYTINSLERQGVSAIVIEDKIGLKKNSLFKNQSNAQQDSIKNFCKKIKKIISLRKSKDFLVVARIESFILGKGLNDAINRAESYSKAGADAIVIHSKESSPKQVFSFAKKFKKNKFFIPMIAIPSSYSKTLEKELIANKFSVVIYANHMLRSAYKAMKKTALTILKKKRSYESEANLSSIKEIINLKEF